MTDQNTFQELYSDRTPVSGIADPLPEFRSGSLEPIQSDLKLTPLQVQGAMRVLRFLQRDRQEVEHVLGEVNFDRQKGIFSGMKRALDIAIHSIIDNHPEIL